MEIKEKGAELLKRVWRYLRYVLRWLLVACITGAIGGLAGTLFAKAIEYVTLVRSEQSWLIFLAPAAGVLTILVEKLFRAPEGFGTDNVITAARNPDNVPLAVAPSVFIGTVLTHLVGGSAGREGASLQIGGSIGLAVGRLFRMDEKDLHMMVLCGMSALFSAVFRAPLTAAIFVLEVVSVGEMYYGGLIPCVTSSFVAYGIALAFGCKPLYTALAFIPEFTAVTALQTAFVAAIAAVVSILFCVSMRAGAKYAKKLFKNRYVRILAGSAILIGLTLLVGSRDYNGAGENVIHAALYGDARPYAFILNLVFTAVTIAVGFKGGEIVPAFFVGATLGCTVAPLVGLDPGFGAAVGMVCMFCGIVNCPVASIILSVEAFGASGLLLFAVGCALSYTLSGYYGLYGSQKIVFSKVRTVFVDKFTNRP